MIVKVKFFDCLHKIGIAWTKKDGKRTAVSFDIDPELVERIRKEGIQVELDEKIKTIT